MSKKHPQLEDAIIKEALTKIFHWSVLICFVIALCLLGYLASENEQKAYTIQEYETKAYLDSVMIECLFEVDSLQGANPVTFEFDKDSIYNLKY